MSFLANKQWYLETIRQYLDRRMAVEEFVRTFTGAWQRDREEETAIAETWPARYDLELVNEYRAGGLSYDDFERRWRLLWGYQGEEAFLNLVDATYAACSDYTTDPELLAIGPPQYFTDEALRQYLGQILGQYMTSRLSGL